MAGKTGMKASRPSAVPPDASPHDNLLALVDGRSLPARAVNGAYGAIMIDLGGEQHVSYILRSLALRAANVQTWLASVEARLLSGEKADADLLRSYLHANNVLLGLFRTIGLERRAHDGGDIAAVLAGMRPQPLKGTQTDE